MLFGSILTYFLYAVWVYFNALIGRPLFGCCVYWMYGSKFAYTCFGVAVAFVAVFVVLSVPRGVKKKVEGEKKTQ
jgi:hypothetical protein